MVLELMDFHYHSEIAPNFTQNTNINFRETKNIATKKLLEENVGEYMLPYGCKDIFK